MGSQNDINPTATTEIHDNIPRLKVRKTGWIATSPGEIERYFRGQRKLFFAIKPLVNSIARTRLLFARSTGIPATTCFSEFVITSLHNLFGIVRYHFCQSFLILSREMENNLLKLMLYLLPPHEIWAILHLTFEYHTVLMDVKG
jgi:hypothetical protein